MLDAFEANLRRGIVYSDIAEMFFFLANVKATKLEIVRGVKLLEEAIQKLFTRNLPMNFCIFICTGDKHKARGLQKSNLFPCLMETLIKLCARKKFTLPFLMWKHYLDQGWANFLVVGPH